MPTRKMLKTYNRLNNLNHTYMRYTGRGSAGAPPVGSDFNILTEDSNNLTTEDNDAIIQENG